MNNAKEQLSTSGKGQETACMWFNAYHSKENVHTLLHCSGDEWLTQVEGSSGGVFGMLYNSVYRVTSGKGQVMPVVYGYFMCIIKVTSCVVYWNVII